MTKQATPMIRIDTIVIEEGLNARQDMDQEALKRLGKSIARHELVQPITVRPIEADRFALISGHRRVEAAKLEDIKELPAHIITTGNPRTISFVENVHREQLDKIEEAKGIEGLAKELNLTTNKAVALEVGMSQTWVSSRRRLLKLPEAVQGAIARDVVPLEAAGLLKKTAEVSPRVAECICEVFERDPEFTDFPRDFSDMLYAVAHDGVDDPPIMIDPDNVRIAEVFDDADKQADYTARYREALGIHRSDPRVLLGDPELMAARAARVLLEHEVENGDYSYTVAFITDKEWAADLVVSAIERAEKAKKKRDREEKKRDKERGTASPDASSGPRSKQEDERAEQRAAAKKEREEQCAAASAYNDRLGHALMKHRTVENRKKYGLARAKAAAISLIRHDRSLATAGLRLVLPQLQQTQTGADGDGEISYATSTQAADFLIGKVKASQSQAEVSEWITLAQIAALLADEDALNAGEGSYRHDPAEGEVTELLAEEIKTVKPRRSPKQRKESQADKA